MERMGLCYVILCIFSLSCSIVGFKTCTRTCLRRLHTTVITQATRTDNTFGTNLNNTQQQFYGIGNFNLQPSPVTMITSNPNSISQPPPTPAVNISPLASPLSSDLGLKEVEQKRSPGVFGRIRNTAGWAWNGVTGIFRRDNTPTKTTRVIPNNNLFTYEQQGIVGKTGLFFRRRLLNIFNRSPKKWAKAVEGSTMNQYATWSAESRGKTAVDQRRIVPAPSPPEQNWLERLQDVLPFGQASESETRRRRAREAQERRIFREGFRRRSQPMQQEKQGLFGSIASFITAPFQSKVSRSARSVTALNRPKGNQGYIESLDSRSAKSSIQTNLEGAANAVGSFTNMVSSAPRSAVGAIGQLLTLSPPSPPPTPVSTQVIPPAPQTPNSLSPPSADSRTALSRPSPLDAMASIAKESIFSTTAIAQLPTAAALAGKAERSKDSINSTSLLGLKITMPVLPSLSSLSSVMMPWDRFYRGDMPFFDNGAINPEASVGVAANKDVVKDAVAGTSVRSAPAPSPLSPATPPGASSILTTEAEPPQPVSWLRIPFIQDKLSTSREEKQRDRRRSALGPAGENVIGRMMTHDPGPLQEEYLTPWERQEKQALAEQSIQKQNGAAMTPNSPDGRGFNSAQPMSIAVTAAAATKSAFIGAWKNVGGAASAVFPISVQLLSAPIKLVSAWKGDAQQETVDPSAAPALKQYTATSAIIMPESPDQPPPSSSNNTAVSRVWSAVGSIAPGARLLVKSLRERIGMGRETETESTPSDSPHVISLSREPDVQPIVARSTFDEESPLHDVPTRPLIKVSWWQRMMYGEQAELRIAGAKPNSIQPPIEQDSAVIVAAEKLLRYDPVALSTSAVPFPLITQESTLPPPVAAAVSSVPASSVLPIPLLPVQPVVQTVQSVVAQAVTPLVQPLSMVIQSVPQAQPVPPNGSAQPSSPYVPLNPAMGKSFISQLPSLQGISFPAIPLPRMSSIGTTLTSAYSYMGYGSIPPMGPVDSSLTVRMGGSEEMRTMPQFIDEERVPLPTLADFEYIYSRKVALSVAAATAVQTSAEAEEFLNTIGLQPLITALLQSTDGASSDLRGDAIHGICCLIRAKKTLAGDVAENPAVLGVISAAIEAPLRGFKTFRSQADRNREMREQYQALALVQRMVRSSDRAVSYMSTDARLKKVLSQIVAQGNVIGYKDTVTSSTGGSTISSSQGAQTRRIGKSMNSTTIVDYQGLSPIQMARVASWGLGGMQWRPRQPGQRGLRILSLDGGGTKGVLSIALLQEVMRRVGADRPHELFDIICGTSTGGIIAVVLGCQRKTVKEMETLYDDFIAKVFGKGSQFKLVSERAFYDEIELEKILYEICGDKLLLDSNQVDCSRVFCVSTKVNNNPPQTYIWRNYNYALGQTSRYPGTFRSNTLTAVRATTAAPTFFTPVQWEGGLYCDGALVANNPCAIALQEAKVRLHQNIDNRHLPLTLTNPLPLLTCIISGAVSGGAG